MTSYQAWAHVNNGEYQYWNRVGDPQPSEAAAWERVHNIALQFWPQDAPRRRLFESRCKVEPLRSIPTA